MFDLTLAQASTMCYRINVNCYYAHAKKKNLIYKRHRRKIQERRAIWRGDGKSEEELGASEGLYILT